VENDHHPSSPIIFGVFHIVFPKFSAKPLGSKWCFDVFWGMFLGHVHHLGAEAATEAQRRISAGCLRV